MLNSRRLILLAFLFAIIVLTSQTLAQGGGTQGFVLVIPNDSTKPYVMNFSNITEPFGIIFPSSARVSLITSQNFTLWGGRFDIKPHVQSGGYRFDGLRTGGGGQTSSSLEAIREFSPEVAVAIEADLAGVLDFNTLRVSDPIPVRAVHQIFVISPDGEYRPTPLDQDLNNSCNSTHIQGVIAFDFTRAIPPFDVSLSPETQGPFPAFQLVTLSTEQVNPATDSIGVISFGIPSFKESTVTFSAITNTIGPNRDKLSIKLFIAPFLGAGDDEIIYRMRSWERFAEVGSRSYASLYELIEKTGTSIYPVGATEVGQLPVNNIISVEIATADCRNFQPSDQVITIDDRPIPYFRDGQIGGEEVIGELNRDDVLGVIQVAEDGSYLCVAPPNDSPLSESELACVEGWRVKKSTGS